MLFKIQREIEQARFFLLSDWCLARFAGARPELVSGGPYAKPAESVAVYP